MMRRSIVALVIVGVFFAACGSASADCNVALVVGVAVCSDSSLIPPDLKPLIATGKDLSAVYSGVTDAIKLLQLVGFIPTDPTPAEVFAMLDAKLESIATELFDHESSLKRADLLADATTAANHADTASNNNQHLPEFMDDDFASLRAVNLALNSELFKRHYNVSAIDGTGWTEVIADRPDHSDGTVYDWRFNVPHLLYATGLRIKVMTAIHPEWRADGHYDDQLRNFAEQLSFHLNKMLNGVKCDAVLVVVDPNPSTFSVETLVACADINTGISAVQRLGGRVADIPPRDRTTCSNVCTITTCFEFLGQLFCSTTPPG